MEDAAARIRSVADRLLPLSTLATGWTAEARPRSPARGAARGGGTRPGPQRGRDRQPSREDHPGGGPERGYDGAKRIAGRKRHILVDTNGLVLAARVHGANLPDRDGGRRLLEEQPRLPRLELVWADGAYTGGFREWAEEERGWRVEVPHHRDRQLWRYGLEEKPRGSLVLPRR